MQVLAWLERHIIHLLRKSINSPLLEQSAQDQNNETDVQIRKLQ